MTTSPGSGQQKAAPDATTPIAGGPAGGGNERSAEPGVVPSLYGRPDESAAGATRLPPSRPPELWAGAVFLTLAALPVAVLGLLLAAQPGQVGANLRQKIINSGAEAEVETILGGLRLAGIAFLVFGLAFGVLAWLVLRPRRAARTAVTALAVIKVVLLIFAMVVGAPDPVSVGVLLLAVAGVVLLYLPRSEEFLSFRR